MANQFSNLSIPPSDHINNNNSNNNIESGVFTEMLDELGFDLSFDDIIFPPSEPHADPFLNNFSNLGQIDFGQPGSQLIQTFNHSSRIFKSSPELRHVSVDLSISEGTHSSGSQSSSGSHVLTADVSEYLNVSSILNCPSPESQGSGNSVISSPNFVNNLMKCGVVEPEIKLEDININTKYNKCSSILKRKKVSEDFIKVSKYQKSDSVVECSNVINNNNNNSDGDEKKKARLIRNRESAQLSRQRKKHYVEELEDKVRTMHSTIQDLNVRISYIMSENATLRSQMGGTGGVPPQMAPPPGMYPQVMYPWMACAPPYMVKPQGSQVPLVPIPRLKPQVVAPTPKSGKRVENKKTKRVASISFLGLLLFMLLFGGLVPIVNVRYGGLREPFTSRVFSRSGYNERQHGRVLVVDGIVNGSSYSGHHNGRDYNNNCSQRGQGGNGQSNFNGGANEFISSSNGSEPLMASLYVPRNDKLVKIDGNLIIHSVLASEKAMASHKSGDRKNNGETGLAVPGDLAPAIPGRHPHHYRSPADGKRALGSGDKEKAKSTMQQWFLEGVAGPMLSSGMCTEVFQFDVSSSPGAIVPAATVRNVSMEERQNATRINKGRNRRILNGLYVPVPGVSHNISEEREGRTGKKEDILSGNSSLSSMVVSVLVDPREAGDGDGDGMIGRKSISRIFVVVLIDSVKYVTYSCMLPFKGTVPLVTT